MYSSVCRMECHEGYEAVGSVERKCVVTANGGMELSGTPLQCGTFSSSLIDWPQFNRVS